MWTALVFVAVFAVGSLGFLALACWLTPVSKEEAQEPVKRDTWYVTYILPNHQGARDGAVWTFQADSADDALTQFDTRAGDEEYRILCCTQDFGLACERLLT